MPPKPPEPSPILPSSALGLLARLALLALLIAFSVAATRLLLNQGRADYAFFFSADSDRGAIAYQLDPTIADYSKAQGDKYFRELIPPDLQRAAAAYRNAVLLNPYESFHWADWAEANWRLGRLADAEKAFAIAAQLDPANHLIRQKFGDFLIAQGRPDDAAPHYASAILLRPGLARPIYSVYWGLGRTPLSVAQQLLGDDPVLLRRYFLDCLGWMPPADVRQLWTDLAALGKPGAPVYDAESYRAYFDFLIARQDYAAAQELWDDIARQFYQVEDIPPPDRLFWNGGFDHKIVLDGGLGWRIAKSLPKGVRAFVDSSKGVHQTNCLHLYFDGKENVAFSHVRHLFFVEPGKKYKLSYRVNALDITTDNGPYVKVIVRGERPVEFRSKVVTGTGDWRPDIVFDTPPDARLAELVICRDESRKLNNKIKGDAWFDDFKLELLEPEPTPEP